MIGVGADVSPPQLSHRPHGPGCSPSRTSSSWSRRNCHPAAVGDQVVEHRLLLALAGLGDPGVAVGVVDPRLAGRGPPALDPTGRAVDVEDLEHRLEPGAGQLDAGLERGRAHRAALLGQHLEGLADELLAREGQGREVGPDVAVLGGRQEHHRRLVDAAARAADLLVVGDRRLRRPQVDHEPERRVEAHAQGARGHQRLDPAGGEVGLEGRPLGGVGLAGVGVHVVAPRAQVAGDLLGGRHGEAVDDARSRLLGQVVGQPGQPLLGGLQPDHPEAQRLAVERAAQHEDVGRPSCSATSAVTRALAVAVVARTGTPSGRSPSSVRIRR